MAITYKGRPNRERFLAPEDKFKVEKVPLMIPMERLTVAEGIVEPESVLKDEIQQEPKEVLEAGFVSALEKYRVGHVDGTIGHADDVKPVGSGLPADEPIVEKPKKRGRPKKVKEEKESEMF